MSELSDFKFKPELLAVDNYVVFDTETTGLEPEFDELLEIGALKVEHGKIVDRFSTLIRPTNHHSIPPFIVQLTGITNEMVWHQPKAADVVPEFVDFIGDYVLVGQNTAFDTKFVSYALGRPITNTLVDTYQIAQKILPDLESRKLGNLYAYCVSQGAPEVQGRAHRATYDAEMTHIVYEWLKPKLIGEVADAAAGAQMSLF